MIDLPAMLMEGIDSDTTCAAIAIMSINLSIFLWYLWIYLGMVMIQKKENILEFLP